MDFKRRIPAFFLTALDFLSEDPIQPDSRTPTMTGDVTYLERIRQAEKGFAFFIDFFQIKG